MVLRPGSKGGEEEEGGLKQRELREAQGQLGPHWALSNPETPARVCYGQVTCPLSQVTCMHPSLPLSALTPLPLEPEDPWVRASRFTHSPSARITSPPAAARGLRVPSVPPTPPPTTTTALGVHACISAPCTEQGRQPSSSRGPGAWVLLPRGSRPCIPRGLGLSLGLCPP